MHELRNPVDTEKEKSISRTKKSAISLADILAKEGVSIIVPGGGLAYELGKLLWNHTKTWYRDRTEARLEEFHERLLEGIPKESQEEFLKNEFSPEEYYSILNHVLQDEEDKKVGVYSRIFQGLQLNLIPDEYRLHLIKCSRELKCSDFELIRQLYINEKYEFKAPGNRINQINSITISNDPIKAHSIQTLIRWGFLSTTDTKKPPWPTKLLKFFVEFLYDEENLTAESLGKQAKTAETEKMRVFIACDALGDGQNTKILLNISNSLFKVDIKNVIANPIRKSLPLIISPIIAICLTSKGSPFENIKKCVNIEKKSLIQILLPGAKRSDLPIKDAPTFDFTSENQNEVKKFVEFVESLIIVNG